MLNGSGGMCFVNNVGIYFLLDSLNFDVSLAMSSVSSPDNHLVCIVKIIDDEEYTGGLSPANL